jgi:glyoxylase I family protein
MVPEVQILVVRAKMTEPNPFRIRDIDHVVLRVTDMKWALTFYCGVLGCREERRLDETRLVQLGASRSMINLVDQGRPASNGNAVTDERARNMDHVCLIIEPFDETRLRAHLLEHGINAGKTASRCGAEGSGPSFYVENPDGDTVELKGPRAL